LLALLGRLRTDLGRISVRARLKDRKARQSAARTREGV